MAGFLLDDTPRTDYVDRKKLLASRLSEAEFKLQSQARLNQSITLYIGGLSFYTTETQIADMFVPCGGVKRIVMGLNSVTRAPAGFAFVVFCSQAEARAAYRIVEGARVDDRPISVQWDEEEIFEHSDRRWARGYMGEQVSERLRPTYDGNRGGLGGLRREAAGVDAALREDEAVTYTWLDAPRVQFTRAKRARNE